MNSLLNLLPKIKAVAKAMILVGNFILEIYHTVRNVILTTREQFKTSSAI